MKNIVINYINIITKEDINNYLIKQNIILSENELNYAYKIVKNNYNEIFEGNIDLFNDIKNNINNDAYNKLIDLYNKYSFYLKK